MIRVLVVEDSPVVCELLVHILSSDPGIRVIGTAKDGEEAIDAVRVKRPDIITMDITMPKMNGLEVTRIIMETNPVPIIIVTGSMNFRDVETSFRAMEAGALTVLLKPKGIGHPDHEANARELIQTVKLMSEIRMVRRWARPAKGRLRAGREYEVSIPPPAAEIKVVAIGASTGGPPVIQKILSELPKDFPVPVLIVQHMADGFVQGFAEWLKQTSALPIQVASDGIDIIPGHAYIAPPGAQMKVVMNGRLSCTDDHPENGLRPSISYTFRSVAGAFGRNAVGVLLTGMGKDGAEELKLLREKGAVTIAQDKESSVVFGMPAEAIKLDAAMYVLSPERIAETLTRLVTKT